MGKVGRKLLIYDRKNMFKVSLQHLRHATLEERAVAQSDGREMLGIAQYVREQGNLKGSHYVDLTSQDKPLEPSDAPIADQAPADAPSDSVHVAPSSSAVAPVSSSNAETPEAVSNMPSQPPSGAALISAEHPKAFVRSEPFHDGSHSSGVNQNLTYGPTRYRNSTKGPEVVRPPKLLASDFMEAHHEVTSHKRQPSRELRTEPFTKAGRTDITAGDEALLIEHQAAEAEEVFLIIEEQGESAEVFLANFLKKKMQTELHHSNNPHELQEAIDQAKTTECLTLRDEKQALVVIPPHLAKQIRKKQPGRIMSCRFVITEKTEDGDTKIKARWCLRGSHDPDLVQEVLSGKCHSPTLAQFSRNMLLQIVSHRWTMKLGDIKGAFRSQCQRSTVCQSCVCWLPPGGVPGIERGSLVQVTGNIYGANDAPHTWYVEFDQNCNRTRIHSLKVRQLFVFLLWCRRSAWRCVRRTCRRHHNRGSWTTLWTSSGPASQ